MTSTEAATELPWEKLNDQELLEWRICDLKLKLEDSLVSLEETLVILGQRPQPAGLRVAK